MSGGPIRRHVIDVAVGPEATEGDIETKIFESMVDSGVPSEVAAEAAPALAAQVIGERDAKGQVATRLDDLTQRVEKIERGPDVKPFLVKVGGVLCLIGAVAVAVNVVRGLITLSGYLH